MLKYGFLKELLRGTGARMARGYIAATQIDHMVNQLSWMGDHL